MDRSPHNPAFDEAIAGISERLKELTLFQGSQLEKFMLGAQQMGPTGSGNSIRTRLLGLANHACMAELSEDECFAVLREYIHGKREVGDDEIWGVIERAWADHDDEQQEQQHKSDGLPSRATKSRKLRTKKVELSGEHVAAMIKLRDKLIDAGRGATFDQIKQRSPIKLSMKPKQHLFGFLQALYQPNDQIFMDSRYGRHVYEAQVQMRCIDKQATLPEFIIPNPFSGKAVPSKTSNKKSRRCDAAVSDFKYAIAEFDDISLGDQLAFWFQIDLPIVALIYSGSKSIHAWIKIEGVTCEDEWNTVVREQLYGQFLIPMGVDPSCRNPSRLSRTPGHHREGKKDQHCFYLAPQGKAVLA